MYFFRGFCPFFKLFYLFGIYIAKLYKIMTKIAIPHWQGRVSPVFDVAGRVALAEFVSGGVLRHGDLLLGSEDPQARSVVLASTGVKVLICGAISCCYELALTAAGIGVTSQICGEIDRVLQAYADGRLSYYRMPGCRGCRGRSGHGRGCKFRA